MAVTQSGNLVGAKNRKFGRAKGGQLSSGQRRNLRSRQRGYLGIIQAVHNLICGECRNAGRRERGQLRAGEGGNHVVTEVGNLNRRQCGGLIAGECSTLRDAQAQGNLAGRQCCNFAGGNGRELVGT